MESCKKKISKFSYRMAFLEIICQSNEDRELLSHCTVTLMTNKFPTVKIIENIHHYFP